MATFMLLFLLRSMKQLSVVFAKIPGVSAHDSILSNKYNENLSLNSLKNYYKTPVLLCEAILYEIRNHKFFIATM